MSVFLNNDTVEVDLYHDYGNARRRFFPTSRNLERDIDFIPKSCLFLVYCQPKPMLKNHVKKYYNHFSLFSNDDTVVVVRSELNIVNDTGESSVMYDVITVSDDLSHRKASSIGHWSVSFDSEFQYSNVCPHFAQDRFKLRCTGEWWYYDKGYILNGRSAFSPEPGRENDPCLPVLIYYELHSDYFQRNTCGLSDIHVTYHTPTPLAESNSNLSFNGPLQTLMSLNDPNRGPDTSTFCHLPNNPLQNCMAQGPQNNILTQIAAPNVGCSASKIYRTAVMPSLSWFQQRQEELQQGDLNYFYPSSIY